MSLEKPIFLCFMRWYCYVCITGQNYIQHSRASALLLSMKHPGSNTGTALYPNAGLVLVKTAFESGNMVDHCLLQPELGQQLA